MKDFASCEDLNKLWRPLKDTEIARAEALIGVVSASLRTEAYKVGRDLDAMISEKPALAEVAKSVTVDVVARTLMTSTEQEPLSQFSQTAGPYTTSGTYLVPGGGIFIKKSELARLGLRRQRMGVLDIYGISSGNDGNTV